MMRGEELAIAPRWSSKENLDRSQPSPLAWAEEARAFGPEDRRFLRGLVAPTLDPRFRREAGLRPEEAALT
jgi:hypothetical protein